MSDQPLYDQDILLWSEQQAEVIRRLGRMGRDLPNELDVENVAEEIESVGRSELAAVKSHIRLICLHLIKLVIEEGSEAVPHWQGEILAFHAEMIERYAPSMRQRIDLNAVWRSACEQSMLVYEKAQSGALPANCPFTLDDLLGEHVDVVALVERLRNAPTT